jgi:hypothetical protein
VRVKMSNVSFDRIIRTLSNASQEDQSRGLVYSSIAPEVRILLEKQGWTVQDVSFRGDPKVIVSKTKGGN